MVIDVPDWKKKEEWKLPFEVIEGTKDPETAGTTIVIKSYSDEISERLKSGSFDTILKEMIESTYCLFLNRYVELTLNGLKSPLLWEASISCLLRASVKRMILRTRMSL